MASTPTTTGHGLRRSRMRAYRGASALGGVLMLGFLCASARGGEVVTGLRVKTLRGSLVELAWDAFPGAVAYQVQRDGVFVVESGGLTGTDMGRTPRATHAYTVRARINYNTFSEWSAPLSVTLPGPSPVTAMSVNQNGAGLVLLMWNAPADDSFPFTYELYRDGVLHGTSPHGFFADTQVVLNQTYVYAWRTCWTVNTPNGPEKMVSEDSKRLRVTCGGAWELLPDPDPEDPDPEDPDPEDPDPEDPEPGEAPAQVTGLASSHVQPTFGRLTWAAVEGAAKYQVRRDGAQAAEVTATAFDDGGRTPGATHVYTVRAGSADGAWGEWSAALTVVFPALPAPPSNVRAAVNDGAVVKIVWDAPPADATVQVFYEVTRGGNWAAGTYGTEYEDRNVVAGQTYTYAVRLIWIAQGTALYSAYTEGLAVTVPLPGGFVGPVTGLKATALTGSSVRLTWDAAVNAAKYGVRRDGAAAGEPTAALFDDTDRIPGTAHTYAVYALSPDGTAGTASEALTVTFPGPATPANFRMTANAVGGVQLAWDALADDAFPAHFEVYRDGQPLGMTDALAFVDATAAGATAYAYTLRARWDFIDAADEPASLHSAFTEALNVTTPAAPPAAVAGLKATALKGSSVRLVWDAAADAARYEVRRDEAAAVAAAEAFHDDTGRIPGTAHVYAVRALSAAGVAGAWSAPLPVTFPGPAVPANFRLAANEDGVVRLAWDALADDSFPARYEVYRDDVLLGEADAASYADATVAPGATYNYTLRARWSFTDAADEPAVLRSGLTAALIVDAVSTLPPVTGLAADAVRGASVRLSWDAFADAASYQLRRDLTVCAAPVETTFTDTGRFPGNAHAYVVRAVLADGSFTAWSAPCAVTFPGPPSPGALRLVDNGHGPIHIAWTATADDAFVAHYEIHRDGAPLAETTALDYADAAVTPGATYAYRVRARWDFTDPASGARSVYSDFVEALSVEALAPIPPVTGLAADQLLGGSVRLVWDALDGAAKYRVRRDGEDIADATGPSFVDAGRIPETAHTYTVKAIMPNGRLSVAWSDPCAVTFPGPRPPSNLRATPDENAAIRLEWDAAPDLSLTPHYEIHQDGEWKVDAGEPVYVDEAILPGGTYVYRVRLRWDFVDPAVGEKSLYSTFTNEASATAAPLEVFVTGLRATRVTATETRIEWDALGGVTHYQVRRGDTPVVEAGTEAFYTDTNYAIPSTHTYTVRALLPNGAYTAWSEPLSVDYAEPDLAVTLRLVENAPGRVVVAWDPPADAASIHYQSIVVNDSHADVYLESDATTATFSYFDFGSTIAISLNITWSRKTFKSEPLFVQTLPTPTPTLLLSHKTTSEIGFDWTFAGYEDDSYYFRDNFFDLFRDDEEMPILSGHRWDGEFVLTGGVAGETHTYRIRARTYEGHLSELSAPLAVTFDAPEAPTLRADRIGTNYVSLKWDTEFSSSNRRLILYRDGAQRASLYSGTEWRDTGLAAGATYTYHMVMEYYPSAGGSVRTDPGPSLAVATRTVATPTLYVDAYTGNSVTLRWTQPANTGYVPEYDIEADGAIVRTTTAGNWTEHYLTPGDVRTYRVRVRLAEDLESDWSDVKTVTTRLPKTPAVNASVNAYSATLSIQRPFTVAEAGFGYVYEIERDGALHDILAASATSAATSWTDHSLPHGDTHVYRVRMRFYEGCESAWTAPIALTTALPAVPVLSLTKQGGNFLQLGWALQNNSGYNMDYEIRRNGVHIETTRGSVYLDTGLLPGRAYVYQIRARFYAGCESAWSAPFTALTLYPDPPSNFRVTGVTARQATLAWNNANRTVAGFDAEYQIEADGAVVLSTRDSTWTHAGLDPGSTFEYRIRTRFFLGAQSAWTAPVSATTLLPEPPRCSVTARTGNALRLSLAESAASGYADVKIEVRRDGETVALVPPGAWQDTGLTPGATYTYTARVVWFEGAESAWSAPFAGTTRLPEPPGVWVDGRSAVAVTLKWNDAFDSGFVNAYDIEKDGAVVHTTTAKTWTDDGMAPGTAATYRVRTRFMEGVESAWSEAVDTATLVPPVPEYPELYGSPPWLSLYWYVDYEFPYDVELEYDVERNGVIVATVANAYNYGSWSAGDHALGHTYTFRVRSRLPGGGESAWSEPVTREIPGLSAPYLEAGSTTARTASFYVHLPDHYDFDGFQLELERDGAVVGTFTDAFYLADEGLTPGVAYTYRARYRYAGLDDSPWSEAVTVTTLGPKPPTLYAHQIVSTSLRLYWSDPVASGYATREFDIYRDGARVHTTADTYWVDSGLTPGATYIYQARTRFYPGCESELGGTYVVAMPQPVVSTPGNFRQTGVEWNGVHLAWNAVAAESGTVAYQLWRNNILLATVTDGTAYVDRDVADGASYSYKLNAFDTTNHIASGKTSDVVATLPARGSGTGLRGRYFADDGFGERLLERLDSTLAFVPMDAAAPADEFVARWEGALQGPLTGAFTLRFETTGGLRVWVDEQLRIDHWANTGTVNATTSVNLRPSRRNTLRIEWRGGTRARAFRFSWQGGLFRAETVPASQLHPLNLIGTTGMGAFTDGASRTSPAWVEGEAPPGTVEVAYRLDDGAWTPADVHEDGHWHLDDASAAGLPMGIVLEPGVDRAVRVDAAGGGVVKSWARTLTWTPTALDGLDLDEDVLYIRRGDSLLWTVGDAAATPGAAVTVRANLMADRAATAGEPVPVRYDLAGRYAVRGFLDGVEVGAVALVVVDIPRQGNVVAMRVRDDRTRGVRVDPTDAWEGVTPTVDEPTLVQLVETGNGQDANQLRLGLRTQNDLVGVSRLFLRINGLEGPVVAERSVQVVSVSLVTGASLPRLHQYPDGRMIIGASVRMTPAMPDVPVVLNGLYGEVLFDGVGGMSQRIVGRDFDQNGQFNYCLISTRGNCHRIVIPDLDDQP